MKDDQDNVKLIAIYAVIGVGIILVAFGFAYMLLGAGEEPPATETVEQCLEFDTLQEEYDCLLAAAINSSNPAYCSEVKGGARMYRCVTDLAVVLENGTICENIPDEEQFDQGKCYYQVAVATQERAWCRNIRQDVYKQQCLKQVKI